MNYERNEMKMRKYGKEKVFENHASDKGLVPRIYKA